MTTPVETSLNDAPAWWAAKTDAEYAQVTLYRVNGTTEELLDRITVTPETVPTFEDFQMAVKAEHGGGIFLAVQRGPSGQFTMRERFAIAGFAKKPAPGSDERQGTEGGGLEGLAALLLNAQQASEARTAALLEKLADRPSSDDELTRLERFNSIVNRSAQTPVEREKSLIEQAVEKKILAFMDMEIGGGRQEETGFGWVKDLIDEYGPMLAAGMLGKGDAPPALPAPAARPDAQAEMLQRVKVLLRGMVQLAEFKVPPANTVKRIQEQAGDAWPVLADFIARPDAVAMAASLVPAVSQHPEWFEGFREAVLNPAPEAEEETSGTVKKPAAKKKKATA